MPYKKRNERNNKQSTKKKLKHNTEQKKNMTTRLMIINLKVDDFIYKKKPITAQEANMYAEELETFRHQCCDERYLQVIEKLTSYMKFFIEQLSKDIADVNIIDPIEPIEKIDTVNDHIQNAPGPENNAIDVEMERSISNLSLVDPKDPLDISKINNNFQNEAKMVNSTFSVTKDTLNEMEHQVVNVNTEKNGLKYTKTSDIKAVGQKQTDMVDNSSNQSQNILSGFKYGNNYYLNLDLRNDTNKQSQQIPENISNKITIYNNINNVNNNKPELSNQDVDIHNSELSQNLLSNFDHENCAALNYLHNNTNSNHNKYHVGDSHHETADIRNKVSKYDISNTGTNNVNLEEASKNNFRNQREICDDRNKLSENLLIDFHGKNHAFAYVVHNNTNLSSNQVYHVNNEVNNPYTRNKVTKFNNIETNNNKPNLNELSKLNATKLKETCSYNNTLPQNTILNYSQYNTNLSDNHLYNVDNTDKNLADTRNKLHNANMNTGINNTKLEEVSKLNATIEKNHGGSNKLPQNILSSFQYGNYTVVDVNQNFSNYVNNIANTTIENTKFNSLCAVTQKEVGSNCNKPPQNLLGNFDTAIGSYENNTNPMVQQTQPHYTNYMHNSNSIKTIESHVVPPHVNGQKTTNNPLQNQNLKNNKKQRNTVKKTNEKTTKKRTYSRKSKIINATTQSESNKEGIVKQTVKCTTKPENFVTNCKQKKKRVVINKKKEEIDLSWVESVKFIRKIDREEYIKFDNIEESFWSDLTMPPNINSNDFEYDTINIWKS